MKKIIPVPAWMWYGIFGLYLFGSNDLGDAGSAALYLGFGYYMANA